MKQFGNRIATPSSMGARIGARLINLLIIGFFYGLMYVGMFNYSVELMMTGMVLTLVAIIGMFVMLFVKSATPGAAALGIIYLRADNGQEAKGLILGRYLLTGVFSSVTFGIGDLVLLFTYRDGQHWLDRVLGTVGVQKATIQNASMPMATAFPGPSGSLVQPVRMPQRPPLPAPSAPVTGTPLGGAPQGLGLPPFGKQSAPTGPGFAAPQQPAQAPQSPVVAAQPPVAAPQQSFQPPAAPAQSPAAPSSNPWALDGAAQTPAMPQQPTPAFAPAPVEAQQPSTASFAPAPPAFTPAPTGHTAMLDDATEIDPEAVTPSTPAVVLDDGQVITLETPVVLGRNPVAPANYPQARAVQVVDESMRVSKTHLVVLASPDGSVNVVDLGATNGISVEAGGAKTRLGAEETHLLGEGVTLHFGGRSLRVAQ